MRRFTHLKESVTRSQYVAPNRDSVSLQATLGQVNSGKTKLGKEVETSDLDRKGERLKKEAELKRYELALDQAQLEAIKSLLPDLKFQEVVAQ